LQGTQRGIGGTHVEKHCDRETKRKRKKEYVT